MLELVSLAGKGEVIQSLRELAEQWNNVADPVLSRFPLRKYIPSSGPIGEPRP